MFSMTIIYVIFAFLNILVLVQCAPELPTEDSYGIAVTEQAIRSTLNNLFSTLRLKVPKQNVNLEKYSTIHNSFSIITLRDRDNLNKIATVTRVDNIDKRATLFITLLNEVLKEDNKSDEATDYVYITILIEEFLKKLDNLKEKLGVKKNTRFFDLNKAIIKYLGKNENDFGNTTYLKEEPVKELNGRRIFQGKKARIKRFPFMASILFFNKFQCAGSIVKADLVITSASCLQLAWNNRYYRENPSFVSVQVGSNYYKQGGENIPIMEIYFHPSFYPKTLQHNLALMRLTRVLKIGKYSQKVKMIDFDRHPSPLPSNSPGIVIIGWGATNSINRVEVPLRNDLTYSVLDFYPLPDCQEIYGKEFVTERNFCAGFYSKGSGACNHDAGGPGVLLGSGILYGVISFGSPRCGASDAPTVFTKLGYYTDWIEQIMEMHVVSRTQSTTPRPVHHTIYGYPIEDMTSTTKLRITPFIKIKNKQTTLEPQQDILRMNDKNLHFGEFLKLIFKKKQLKQEQQRQKEKLQKQEKLQDEEISQKQEKLQEKEILQKQEELQEEEILQKQEDLQDEEMQVEEEQEVTGYLNKTQDVNEIYVLRNNTKQDTENRDKLTKNVNSEENQKVAKEPNRQSKENLEGISTTLKPTSLVDNNEKTTTLHNNDTYDASPAHSKDLVPTYKYHNKKKEDISSDQEYDEASDSFNIDFFLESHENPFEVNAREEQYQLKAKEQNKKSIVNLTVVQNKEEKPRSEFEYKNLNDDEEDESDASDGSDSEDKNKNNDSGEDENVSKHRAHVKENSDLSYDSETDGDFELLSIPAEPYKQINSSNSSTEMLIDMLDYEDVVKLLVEEVIR